MDASTKVSKRTQLIAKKNDLMRSTLLWCRVLMTRSVSLLDADTQARLLLAIRRFKGFTEENDPYGEHDFGKVEVDGIEFFWKFDYYDEGYEYFKDDGQRVLTIMQANEY